jgi:hypothetical protein
MTTYRTEESRAGFMCAFSRMVIKDKGRMRVYACTLVDDDSRYDFGSTLKQSLGQRIMMHITVASAFSSTVHHAAKYDRELI